ncbi:putative KEX1 protein [Meredithblackwellia eburnea MCA 4105]
MAESPPNDQGGAPTATRKVWESSTLLEKNAERPNALVILNTPLVHQDLFRKIWAAASVRYCADGGANRLFDHFSGAGGARDGGKDEDERAEFLPDLIRGDLDSLRNDVREYYASKGVRIDHDPDQYSTDLNKCVSSLVEYEKEKVGGKEHQLILLGGLSGRLDQTIHTINALSLLEKEREFSWAIGPESIACVLGPGSHDVRMHMPAFGDTCAVLPIGQPAHVTTKGQEWDLGPTDMYPTSVATAVSSSNNLRKSNGGQVDIDTDVAVVWTVEVRS